MKALVTGGASGLGEAITRALSALPGATVSFTYRNSADSAARLESELPGAKGIRCDFTDAAQVDGLVASLPGMELDVLVHNATTGMAKKHFHKMDPRDFEQGFLGNVMPAIRLTQAALAGFRKKKSGRIITVLTSYLANKPPTGLSEYVAAKAYLHSLAKSWAAENASFGITSNCVSPSIMETGLTKDTDARVMEGLVAEHPLKRLLTPAEAAAAVAWLAGPASAHVNGINLLMNAGADVI